jgi:hypothetical protein
MSTLFQSLTESSTEPAKRRAAPRPRRQRAGEITIDEILEDPRQIEQMRSYVSMQVPMECHSAWSDLSWKAAAMASEGATIAIKRQGVQTLLLMSGVKAEVEQSTRTWTFGAAEDSAS